MLRHAATDVSCFGGRLSRRTTSCCRCRCHCPWCCRRCSGRRPSDASNRPRHRCSSGTTTTTTSSHRHSLGGHRCRHHGCPSRASSTSHRCRRCHSPHGDHRRCRQRGHTGPSGNRRQSRRHRQHRRHRRCQRQSRREPRGHQAPTEQERARGEQVSWTAKCVRCACGVCTTTVIPCGSSTQQHRARYPPP